MDSKAQLLHKITTQFQGKRLLVVGDVMLDEFIWGDVRRISPEAPVPIVEIQRHTWTPGGAGNTAMNLASLGAKVFLGAAIGEDHEAGRLCATLSEAAIEVDGLIVDKSRTTTTKTRILAHSQQVVRLDRERKLPLPADVEERLLAWAGRTMPAVDVCIISDYGKGVVSARFCRDIIALAQRFSRPIVVDPKGTDYSKYQGATVVKPNTLEVQQVLKVEIVDDAGWLEAGARLLALLPSTSLLVSRGAAGMTLFQHDEPPHHIPSVAREVFDVTGAGDTVVSTLALSMAAGATLEQAAHLANRAAAIVVGKVGTTAVSLRELQDSLG